MDMLLFALYELAANTDWQRTTQIIIPVLTGLWN